MFFNILRPRIVVAVLLTIGICIYNTSALVIPDGEYDQLQSRLQTQLLNDNDHNDDNIEDVLNDFKLTGFLSGQIHKALGSYCLSYSMVSKMLIYLINLNLIINFYVSLFNFMFF